MKKSTQALLVSLYPTPDRSRYIQLRATKLQLLTPELSESGYRSLLYLLERKGLINREQLGPELFYSLSDKGRRAVEDSFPALSPRYDDWAGDWQCLVFLTAPHADPQFRYLRRLLLDQGCVPLSRGVFLSAAGFSERVTRELEAVYTGAVVVFETGTWQFGSERPIVVHSLGLDDIATTYSGISKELNKLLSIYLKKIPMKNQAKSDFYQSYVRFLSALQADPGFTTRYFTTVESPLAILNTLQRLIQL